jgi:sigma-B regulation protein RsbU (phosphoserine phosphatase)
MAKILLVDDSEPNRDMLARRLARKGHVVIQAGDGQQAVEMTRSESPDLILMDLNLPVLDGWTATRQIKTFPGTSRVPVIALTAHAMSGDRQKALQAGCDDYDTKPVDFPRLLGKIDALFKSPAQTPPAPQEQVERVMAAEADRDDSDPATTTTSHENGVSGRVLVVDDTEANRAVAERWLRRKGFAVDTAADGYRALEMVQKAHYDVVLLDVMMPGMNGISVLRTLRESRSPTELPVIMATAKDASDDVVEALTLGANDYVTKPLDFPVLMARVGTQVSLKRSVEQIYQLERGLEQRNRELHAANTRMQSDLVAAAKIQAALLPTAGPQVRGYRFAWLFEPSATLAGDILNVFNLNDQQIGAYVLDVSGHGVAAALLSVTVSRFLSPTPDTSSLLWRRADGDQDAGPGMAARVDFELETPARVAERLSLRFPFDDVTGQFFTMVYGLLDTQRHTFRYVSAGHPNILHVTAEGEGHVADASGFPIGVGPGDYDEQAVTLAPGDRIYIHSDGLTEAMNPAEEMFGTARMLSALQSAHGDSLQASLARLSDTITKWTASAERKDDQTVLAIEHVAGHAAI